VITFTGSASTGLKLKAHPTILNENVPFNLEADSLNCIVLGEDVTPEKPEWDIFIKEVRKEMTAKAGQKCTAIRRIFVPENKMEEVWKVISKSLSQTTIGNPENEKVRMGSLAGQSQREEVRSQVQKLLATSQIIYGSLDSVEVIDADVNKGAFISPLLLLNEKPFTSEEPHNIEAFGPVSTIMPYKNLDEAIALSKKGKGSLCSSIVTADTKTARDYVIGVGTHHGRILVLNNECAKESTGHGSPLPLLVHGGPGRAGGGEEMGVFYLFFKKVHVHPQDISLPPLQKSDHAKIALQGFLVNTLNPGVMIFWLTSVTAIALLHTTRERIIIFGTCLVVNMAADVGKVVLAGKLRSKLTLHNIRLINRISGFILICFGTTLLIGVIFFMKQQQ
jgi:phenylacetic acid degradation protein PaaN